MLRTSVKSLHEPAFVGVIGFALLVITWMLLLVALVLFVEAALTPWDVVPTSQRPALGTWERTLNDSFENGAAGLTLSALWIVVIYGKQLRLALSGLMRRDGLLPFKLTAANGLFLLLYAAMQAVSIIPASPNSLAMLEVIGYQRTWPAIVLFAGMVFGLVAAQRKIGLGLWLAHTPS